MKRNIWIICFVVVGIGALPLAAQDVGVRAGVSFDPEQFYFGVHGELGPVVDMLEFRPNLEIGVGDNRTVVALNGEFVYPFELQNGTPLYAGGGPAIVLVHRDRANRPGTTTDVEPGFNFLIGTIFHEGYFAELKVGLIDSPEFKIGVGYTF